MKTSSSTVLRFPQLRVLVVLLQVALANVVFGQTDADVEAFIERYEAYNRSRPILAFPKDAQNHTRRVTGAFGWSGKTLEFRVDHPVADTSPPIHVAPHGEARFHTNKTSQTRGLAEESQPTLSIDPVTVGSRGALGMTHTDAANERSRYIKRAEIMADLPLTVTTRNRGDTTEITGMTLKAVDQWKQRSREIGPTMAVANVDRAMDHVEQDFQRWVQQPESITAERELQASLHSAEEAIVMSYQEGVGAASERELLCQQLGDIREAGLKARFGRMDNYRPEVYELIYQNSRSCCALVRAGEDRPFGTGVLIGEGLILTCLHNFTLMGLEPSQCEAWFNYESTHAHPTQAPDVFPLGDMICAGQPIGPLHVQLDFALVELRGKDDGPRIHELTNGGELKYPLPTLDDRQLLRDDAIYVVGHPAGAMRLVHDNAFVLFPFRTNQFGFDKLRMEMCYETNKSPDSENEWRQFMGSFISRSATSPFESSKQYEQYSLRWEGMPVFAADCDTSRGNSGSPVFDRLTNGLIGLLHAGEADLSESYQSGWRRHEAILPIELIISQATSQSPDWLAKYQVKTR
ncbi:trypsin-like peptidase domain-containing protein [Allorhodopirellula heiligendammensis]|uniref:Serine protease n=1 Tax=Allorhodopirellula heiligendammensis TaxID=2714739 RepID=A0A5C6BYC5_9BACT|nr:trypsin-like peptidase domain-containing protein [Allorhodopirellula heiligendammensis]TWU16276.1 hypothetical protein Poly21_34810 [Allorhodopirellula heiligendammensis]